MDFKDILPFITFFLGIFLTPYIETRKEKAKIKSLKKNILIELEDERLLLERTIKITSDSIETRKKHHKKHKHISLGKRFTPILLSKYIDDVYSDFNQDTRKILKNILSLSDIIKEKYDFVCENWNSDNLECQVKEESMLYSMLSVYYALNQLKNEGDRFCLQDLSNDEVVERAAKALQIPTPFKAP
ncbi:hypothetical protein [Kluyvera sp. CRP]|uniref:hypothetical protein n=1 Tax=Kluyvera sp. CRP TaxID=2873269 RepID=UPI001CC20300|nr:hypothetical protein [Kluyvera sp. CRP]UAK18643.1 hypothetical protein K7B04_15010 [Kluyvera sp. CRP]